MRKHLIVLEFNGTSRVLVDGLSSDGADRLLREMAEAWAEQNDGVYTKLDDDTYLVDGGIARKATTR